MASQKKIHRYTAGKSGSSVQASEETVVSEKVGLVLGGADYLWEKLPFSKYEYERWPKFWRAVLGYMLWSVVLPLWPLVVILVLWFDGRVARKTLVFTLLGITAALWFWFILSYFGILR